jgi:cell division protein ZapA (FtsZ GTPase activity inhibitor)
MNEKLDIMILGTSLRVTASNADELNHLHKAAKKLDQKMQMIQSQNPNTSPEKIAIMAALNTTYELHALQAELESRLNSIEQLVIG